MEEKQTEVKNTQKKKIDIKKTLRNLLVLVLVAAISIVGTLAYLSTLSEEKPNSFVGSPGIKVELKEDNFKDNIAQNYTPGMTIQKDPTMENTTGKDDVTEWVAIAVSYSTVGDGNAETFVSYGDIKNIINPIVFNALDGEQKLPESITDTSAITNGDYWTPILAETDTGKYAIYMYSRVLDNSSGTKKTTYPLFDSIKINSESVLMGKGYTQTDSNTGIETVNPPKFNINVIGAAIMNEYYTKDTKTNTTPTKATKLSELDDTDLGQIKTDLKEVLEKYVKDATNGWGITS